MQIKSGWIPIKFHCSSIIDLFLVIEKTFGSFQLSHTMADTVYKESNVLSVVSGIYISYIINFIPGNNMIFVVQTKVSKQLNFTKI